MNPKTKAEFEKLLCRSHNKTCIDCNAFNPQWASVNNGCFMCIKCAGNHRSMGVHITFVRSVTMDGWSNTQLNRMKHGGNGKLKQFWLKQKFPKNLTPKQRLDNKAMDKYRENLLCLAKGDHVKDIPFIGYIEREINANKSLSNISAASCSSSSLSSIHSGSNSNIKMHGFGNTDYKPNNTKTNHTNEAWNDLSLWASSVAAKTSAVASDLAQKSKQKATTLKNKINDEEYQANLKKNAAETWEQTTKTLSSWWNTAAISVTNVINENITEKKQNESIVLYRNDKKEHKQMPALSSDQYFDRNNSNNTEDKEKEKKKTLTDDFDDWGFDDNKKKKVESLLDFDKNDNAMNGKQIDTKPNATKDGNSSDELDAFFNEIENENNEDNKNKSTNDDLDDLLASHDPNNKNDNDNTIEDDWGW